MLAGVILLFVYVSANATVKPVASKLTKEDVINIYIDAMAHGDMKGLDNVLDDSLQYDIQRAGKTNTMHKDELMDYLNSNPADPSVTTSSAVIQEDDGTAMIKVIFNYSTYTRTDMVTLDNFGGWMITKVVSVYS